MLGGGDTGVHLEAGYHKSTGVLFGDEVQKQLTFILKAVFVGYTSM